MKTTKYLSRNKQKSRNKKKQKTIKNGGTNTKESTAAKTIQKFMRTPSVSERRTSLFLKNICSDSKTCIAFGIEQKKIYDFFDGYTNKEYIKLPILPIEKVPPSKNGFVNKIQYERDGYKSHAILKSSLKHGADSLVYEYIVGKYLNKMSKFYPCIMQTYALIQYEDEVSYHMMHMSKDAIKNKDDLESVEWKRIDVDPINHELLYQACSKPLQYAVLTQHIQDSLTLSEIVSDFGIIQHTILCLHQIYFTLHCLRNHFTHYDLHLDNILCYSVGNFKYIEFKYYMNDGSIINYYYNRLAYMIDYGRCYFYESEENNSAKIFDTLCKVSCPTPCGAGDGFKFLFGNPKMFINSTQRNMSADLRAMKLGFHPHYGATPQYRHANKNIFDKVIFNGSYSTPELLEEGFFSKNRVNNISDAFHGLTSLVAGASSDLQRIYISKNYTKLGTLHIYEDGITPIRYEPDISISQPPPPVETSVVAPPVPPTKEVAPPIPPTTTEVATKKQKIDTRISTHAFNPSTSSNISEYMKTYVRNYTDAVPPPFKSPKKYVRPDNNQPIMPLAGILRNPTTVHPQAPIPVAPAYDPSIFDADTPPAK